MRRRTTVWYLSCGIQHKFTVGCQTTVSPTLSLSRQHLPHCIQCCCMYSVHNQLMKLIDNVHVMQTVEYTADILTIRAGFRPSLPYRVAQKSEPQTLYT